MGELARQAGRTRVVSFPACHAKVHTYPDRSTSSSKLGVVGIDNDQTLSTYGLVCQNQISFV